MNTQEALEALLTRMRELRRAGVTRETIQAEVRNGRDMGSLIESGACALIGIIDEPEPLVPVRTLEQWLVEVDGGPVPETVRLMSGHGERVIREVEEVALPEPDIRRLDGTRLDEEPGPKCGTCAWCRSGALQCMQWRIAEESLPKEGEWRQKDEVRYEIPLYDETVKERPL